VNYLAHIYLSGADIDLRFGNFIADSVPNKNTWIIQDPFRKGFYFIGKLIVLPISIPFLELTKTFV
tara:strand:+ start:640 stop:837 length:198 start_codon:yes stop_codon:yes gene_type:complete